MTCSIAQARAKLKTPGGVSQVVHHSSSKQAQQTASDVLSRTSLAVYSYNEDMSHNVTVFTDLGQLHMSNNWAIHTDTHMHKHTAGQTKPE